MPMGRSGLGRDLRRESNENTAQALPLLLARGISAGNNPHPALRLGYSASLGVPCPMPCPSWLKGSLNPALLWLQHWHRDLGGCQP